MCQTSDLSGFSAGPTVVPRSSTRHAASARAKAAETSWAIASSSAANPAATAATVLVVVPIGKLRGARMVIWF